MSTFSPLLTPISLDHLIPLLRFERSNADYFEQFVPKRPLRMLTDEGMTEAIGILCHEAETGQGAYYVVFDDDDIVARINLVYDGERVDLGYRVAESMLGAGWRHPWCATRMEKLKEDGFDMVTAHALSSNPASIRVLEKCGFGISRIDQDGGKAFGFDADVVHFEQLLLVELV